VRTFNGGYMGILIEVTTYDDTSGEVLSKRIITNIGSYGYEIESAFSDLGEEIARHVDPNFYAE